MQGHMQLLELAVLLRSIMDRDAEPRDNGDYDEIDEIQQEDSNQEDYEYPTSLDAEPRVVRQQAQQTINGGGDDLIFLSSFPPQAAALGAGGRRDQGDDIVGYAKAYELMDHDPREELIPESFSSASDSSLSESEKVFKEIRQKFPSQDDLNVENDDKLFITGNLENSEPPFSFKSSIRRRSGAVSEGRALQPDGDEGGQTEEGEEEGAGLLEDQGIYQGLVMTDDQRRQLGIMPESIYMTTNLENWLENMAANEPHPSAATTEERPVPTPVKPSVERRYSGEQHMNHTPRSVKPHYRDSIIRAPPLPPVDSRATRAERKAHAVVEQLLKSEAAFLSSLNIAIEVYKKPLEKLAEGSTPILDREQVKTIFGPVADIVHHHELFYSALLSRTLDWHIQQKIGDIFMSSMHNKALVRHYTSYVNNFAVAMHTLERSIMKKTRFVQFLKEKYQSSKTSLSLQGLLLKPIQRFPQYILFLTDLLKYTSPDHPDRITLQMALANLEGIASYLNEAKRVREQQEVVSNLSAAVTRLPFRLSDSKRRWLHRQDVVTRLLVKNGGRVHTKHRCLLLFNNMVICAAAKRKRKSPKQELESTTGSREFQGTVDTAYTCKWFAPLSEVHIEEPDYHAADVWDKALLGQGYRNEEGFSDNRLQNYQQLKQKYRAAGNDFETLTRIANLIFTLSDEYQGLTKDNISDHIRVLQRKIAKLKEQIKACQLGRIDLAIPSRDASKKVCHTYRFPSEKIKEDWICAVRYAKLRLSAANRCAWVTGEDFEEEDEEVFSLTHKLPLVVENTRLNMIDKSASVTCAAKVGLNTAWLAGGDRQLAQVTVVECVTPNPIVLECFQVNSTRITDVLYVPPAPLTQNEATLTATMKRVSMRSTLQRAGSLTSIPPHMATVWLGAQCGKLSIYSAESVGDGTKKCLATVKFDDAVTSMCYYHDQVYISTADGCVVVFRRSGSIGWDLVNRRVVEVTTDKNVTIRCSCRVVNKLWLGVGGTCHILNLQTLKLQSTLEMSTSENAQVSHMVCWGEGVWVSYRNRASLQLWHTISKKQLQDINIKQAITGIVAAHHLETKIKISEFVHVTVLMAASGFLWIGTSIGLILIYRIPHLEGIPIISGKPYLAMDAHKGAVRVLLSVMTKATISSSRVDQFLSDEQRRFSLFSQPDEEEEGEGEEGGAGETLGKNVTLTEGSKILEGGVAGILEESEEEEEEGGAGAGMLLQDVVSSINDAAGSGREEEVNEIDDRSPTPPFPLSPPPPTTAIATENDAGLSSQVANQSNDHLLPADDVPTGPQYQPLEEEEEEIQLVNLDEQITEEEEPIEENGQIDIDQKVDPANELEVPIDNKIDQKITKAIEYENMASQDKIEETETINGSSEVQVGKLVEIEEGEKLNGDELSSDSGGSDGKDEEVFEVVGQNGAGETEREGDKNGHVDESGIYSNPTELDRIPRPTRAKKKKEEEEIYSIPHEILPPSVSKKTVVPAGYENPSALNDKGPVVTRGGLFSPEFAGGLSPTSFTLPGRETEPKQGAIFVLTAGRGLVNLRPGLRSPGLLFPTSSPSTSHKFPDKADEEGAMIAYEVEMLQ